MATISQISIAVPAYRAARFLPETLETVRAQTFAEWELIVVEDGSRDGTEEIVRGFAASVRQPVRYLRHEVNRQLPATRNTGIDAASAAWVALLDGDDLWTPDHLAVCVERASRGDVDLVHGGAMLFESETGRDIELRAPGEQALADFPFSLYANQYVIQPSTVLMAKALWTRVGGFNPKFHHLEDREMWLRCVRAGGRVAYTGRDTCRYRKHRVSMSAPIDAVAEMAENSAKIFEHHLDWEIAPRPVRRRLAAEAWAAAARLRWRSSPAVARRYFARACEFDWRARWWLHGTVCSVLSLGR